MLNLVPSVATGGALAVIAALDTGTISKILLLFMVLLVVGAFLIVRFVSQAGRRLIWLVGVCFLLLGSYAFRSEISTCSQTCDCKLITRDINVSSCVAGKTQEANTTSSTSDSGGRTAPPGDNDRVTSPVVVEDRRVAQVIDGANEGTLRPGP